MFDGDRASVWDDENVLEVTVLMVAQHRECTYMPLSRAPQNGQFCVMDIGAPTFKKAFDDQSFLGRESACGSSQAGLRGQPQPGL